MTRQHRVYTPTKLGAGKISLDCPSDCPYIVGIIKKKQDSCSCLTNPEEVWEVRKRCYFYTTRNYKDDGKRTRELVSAKG
jgi:hypothetical protein